MKKIVCIYLLLFSSLHAYTQLIINEFETAGLERIEIKNISNQTYDVNNFVLCSYPVYNQIQDISIVSGYPLMAPGDIVVVNGHPLGDTDGELALYLNFNFTNPNAIIDYVEWGSGLHTRETIAVQAGIWTTNDFIPSPPVNVSLEYDGSGDASTDWFLQQNPTFGLENGILSNGSELLDQYINVHASNQYININVLNSNFPITAYQLYNCFGELIEGNSQISHSELKIEVPNMSKGVYLLRINSGELYTVNKLLIF